MASSSSEVSKVEEYETWDKLFERITSPVKAEREGALATLSRLVKGLNCDEGERKHLIKLLKEEVAIALAELGNLECINAGHFMDKKCGLLSAASVLINGLSQEEEADMISPFIIQIRPHVLNIMKDKDVRVRLLAGELFGSICKIQGPKAYTESKYTILDLVEKEFRKTNEIEGMMKSPETPIDPIGEVAASEPYPATSSSPKLNLSPATTPLNPDVVLSEVLKEAISNLQPTGPGTAGQTCDFTVNFGYAQLESILKCLQFIARGLGIQFGPLIDQQLLDLISPALTHHNRFIREGGFFLFASLIESGLDLPSMGRGVAEKLVVGLSDFCGQVRIAAAVACRKFMLHLPNQPGTKEIFFRMMLPSLCICRYYMADTKFLLYSQETWKIIFAMEGVEYVCKYISEVVEFYTQSTLSDNHAVREAACLCIGELSRKIDKSVMIPHVEHLLDTLKRSFRDDRWHVRDAACLSAGSFFVNFPFECQKHLPDTLDLIFENLQFPISTVRQGAASSIANVVRGYGVNVLPTIMDKICDGLKGIEFQTAESIENVDLPVVNPEMKYSYPPGQGSFVPYARASHPWELADGCLYLLGDISQIPGYDKELHAMVPIVLKAIQHRTYSQHLLLMETLCKVLPCIITGIGKRPFKEYLSQFFEPIFYSIESESTLTSSAGRVCLKELCTVYGPNIIRSRVELYDPRFAHYVDEG